MSTSENAMDFFELDDKTSLICSDATVGEGVREALRELGYKFHAAETSDVAIERTRYNHYDVIVIQEDFGGGTLKTNPILNYFSALPMAQRRYSMLVLIGTAFKTLDAMQAFSQNVQLVVNITDLRNLTAILKKSRTEFDLTYKTYRDMFAATGEK